MRFVEEGNECTGDVDHSSTVFIYNAAHCVLGGGITKPFHVTIDSKHDLFTYWETALGVLA